MANSEEIKFPSFSLDEHLDDASAEIKNNDAVDVAVGEDAGQYKSGEENKPYTGPDIIGEDGFIQRRAQENTAGGANNQQNQEIPLVQVGVNLLNTEGSLGGGSQERHGDGAKTWKDRVYDFLQGNILNKDSVLQKEITSWGSLDHRPAIDWLLITKNEQFVDWYKEGAAKYEDQLANVEEQIKDAETEKKLVLSSMEELKRLGASGIGSLKLELDKIEKAKKKLLGKRDIAQTALEKRVEKVKTFTKKRDIIADKCINKWEEKIAPIEHHVEGLMDQRAQVDLLFAVMESDYATEEERLSPIKQQKKEFEEIYRRRGYTEEKIQKIGTIKQLNKQLDASREKMRVARAELTRRKVNINQKIADAEAKVNPYRDKREYYVRIKENRPIKYDIPKRERAPVFTGSEEAISRPRADREAIDMPAGAEVAPETDEADEEEHVPEKKAEVKEKTSFSVANLVKGWNAYLIENKVSGNAEEMVDQTRFCQDLKKTGNSTLHIDHFANILGFYYIREHIKTTNFNIYIKSFINEFKKAGGTTTEGRSEETVKADNTPENTTSPAESVSTKADEQTPVESESVKSEEENDEKAETDAPITDNTRQDDSPLDAGGQETTKNPGDLPAGTLDAPSADERAKKPAIDVAQDPRWSSFMAKASATVVPEERINKKKKEK